MVVLVGALRYRLLETLREYALQRLQEAEEEFATRERHRAWCQTLVDQAAVSYWSAELGDWLDRLEREHDNLRGRWTGARQMGRPRTPYDWSLQCGSSMTNVDTCERDSSV